ncbi:MAG: gamma-glutamylcyclotransferase [Salinisphaera sp.]|nr:gamma-glutamylcyclotransferase [Salinisphaera sp.]
MHYFAYGSNMLTARLAKRVGRVQPLGPAWLKGHALRFHKRGSDGSGKCNAFATGRPGDLVHGVLFDINEARLRRLHAAEGPGYEFAQVQVNTEEGTLPAMSYRARNIWIDDALAPYTWYQAFVLAGAREHKLPAAYVAYIENLFARHDPNGWRAFRNRLFLRRA